MPESQDIVAASAPLAPPRGSAAAPGSATVATDPIDSVHPDPSRTYAPPDRRPRDDRPLPTGRRPSRLGDGDEVYLSPDAVALTAEEAALPGPLAVLAAWLARSFDTLRRAVGEGLRQPPRRPAPPLPGSWPPPAGDDSERRNHERFDSVDCTVRIDSTVYRLLDVSLGGFTFGPDQGHLIPNQRFYFELRFPGDHPADPVRADGKVVRVRGGVVAAKFFLPLATTRRLITAFVAHNRDVGGDRP